MNKLFVLTLLLVVLLNIVSAKINSCTCEFNDGTNLIIKSSSVEVCQDRCNALASKQAVTCDTQTCTCACPGKTVPCSGGSSSSSSHGSSGPGSSSSSGKSSSSGQTSSGSGSGSGSGSSSGSASASSGSGSGSGGGSGSGSGMVFLNEQIKTVSACQYNKCPFSGSTKKGLCNCQFHDGTIFSIDSPNYEVCQERCDVLASKQVVTCNSNTCTCNCPQRVRPCSAPPAPLHSSSHGPSSSGSQSSSGSGSCTSGSGCSGSGTGSGSGSGSGMDFINSQIKKDSLCQYSHCPCSKSVKKITFNS